MERLVFDHRFDSPLVAHRNRSAGGAGLDLFVDLPVDLENEFDRVAGD